MYRALPFALVALFAATGSALAQSSAGAPPMSPADAFLQHFDQDKDGKVSQAEALAPHNERFKSMDTNGDGFVTAEEASAAFKAQVPAEMLEEMQKRGMPAPGESFMTSLDKDGDGKVSPTEFQQPTIDGFTRLDTNGDGFADRAEAEVHFKQMQQNIEEHMRKMQEMQQQQPPQQ